MQELIGDKNRRILVVDDNRSIHEDFHKILCCHDVPSDLHEDEAILFGGDIQQPVSIPYEVHSAYQGQEGLDKVSKARQSGLPYAMAFVDMRMPPGWDGLETIAQLWKEDPLLQIVICTAFSDYSWSDIANQVGTHSHLLILKKPFDNAEVAQLAASLTEKWDLARSVQVRMDVMKTAIAERTEKIVDAHRETESLLAAISSVLVGVNELGVVVRWNTNAEELFGVSSSKAVGKQFNELDIEWTDSQTASQFFDASNSSAVTRLSLHLVRSGTPRVLGASRYPVTHNGVNRGFLCLGTDITDQCQLELQLQQAQKLEAVGQLAAGVAHEINTPMQYLGDNLEFLQNKMGKLKPVLDHLEHYVECEQGSGQPRELASEIIEDLRSLKVKSFASQVSEAIDDSRDGVQHVSRIVRAMKEFAHPGQDENAPVDINRAIESTIAVSTSEWKCVADVETNLDSDIPLVRGLAGELNQAFLNILVNAAHAISDINDSGAIGKGKISISTRQVDEDVEISIQDSGGGIPDEIKQRIFDPFFTTKDIGRGTGQGLAIAHSVVVQKHGGTLRCESSIGVGTTFFVRLPVGTDDCEIHASMEPTMACN